MPKRFESLICGMIPPDGRLRSHSSSHTELWAEGISQSMALRQLGSLHQVLKFALRQGSTKSDAQTLHRICPATLWPPWPSQLLLAAIFKLASPSVHDVVYHVETGLLAERWPPAYTRLKLSIAIASALTMHLPYRTLETTPSSSAHSFCPRD